MVPLSTWRRTGTDGGTNVTPFTSKSVPFSEISKANPTTAPSDSSADTAGPGAAGFVSGTRSVSLNGRALVTSGVSGSTSSAVE